MSCFGPQPPEQNHRFRGEPMTERREGVRRQRRTCRTGIGLPLYATGWIAGPSQPGAALGRTGGRMRLKEIHVRGYRSLRDVRVPFAQLTSFIGPNGSGKSSVLAALRLFFDDGAGINELDFWRGSNGTAVDELSVEVRLGELTEDEQATFRPYLDASHELVVERRFEEPGHGAYVAQRRAVPAFTTIRRLERAHRQEYQKLVDSGAYPGLASANNEDEVFAAMDDWEAVHPEACDLQEVDFTLHGRITQSHHVPPRRRLRRARRPLGGRRAWCC